MTLAWCLFLLYLAGTAWLGYRGFRQTNGFSSFAVGNRNMNPLIVGVTLAASVSSASTFIINPGFVYVDGFSAFFHLTVGVGIGFLAMLSLLSFQFRRIGAEKGALTIPDWIGKRYKSTGFALFFSVLNLLSFAFIVLLVGGISIVMQSLLGVSNVVALSITLIFVTGYVFIGGTYAHVLTNMLQGTLMIGVSILVLGACMKLGLAQPGSVVDALARIDAGIITWINRDGLLFNDIFSIYVAGFIVGAIVVCQPHILTKALYVDSDHAVRRYLVVFAIVFLLFQSLALVGFFAHLAVDPQSLVDTNTGQFRQDLVMTQFLQDSFPPWVFTIIGIVLLAAAMSTLDGLLVSMSTITANDLVLNVIARDDKLSDERRMTLALRVSHVVLIVIAVAAFVVNLQPPKLLGIFGQTGVYGLTAAAAPPLLVGVLFRRVPIGLAWSGSVAAITVHFLLFFRGSNLFPNSSIAFGNPGVTVSMAIIAVLPVLLLSGFWMNRSAHSYSS